MRTEGNRSEGDETDPTADAADVFVAAGWAETTEPRSWAELIETLQGGVAVLDDAWRIAWANDRFMPLLGPPASIVGRDLRQLLPALGADDPRALGEQVDQGATVDFVQQFWAPNDNRRWFRVTVHPTESLGEGFGAVVFSKDTTETSSALELLREATLSLTEIEHELKRRVARNVHDGPIQLLAALVLRLDLLDDHDRTPELSQIAANVSAQLRAAVAEFSRDERHLTGGQLLQTWIAPFVDTSRIVVEIEDLRAAQVDQSATQAAFVLLYELVRAGLHVGRDRQIHVTLTDENYGDRIILTIDQSTGNSIKVGRVAAQLRAVDSYIKGLGGTLSTSFFTPDVESEIQGPIGGSTAPLGVRAVSAWLPRLFAPEIVDLGREETHPTHPTTAGPDRTHQANDILSLPPLSDEAWEEFLNATPEPFFEIDGTDKYSFANPAADHELGAEPGTSTGKSLAEVFGSEALARLEPEFVRLDLGEVIDVEWVRQNALADTRKVLLRVSPRIGEDGRWLGVAGTVEDLTEIEFLEQLIDSALSDLALSRRLVTQNSLLLLDEPLRATAQLTDLLGAFESATPGSSAIESIATELEIVLPKIRQSLDVITTPDFSTTDLGQALRSSLRSALDDSTLEYVQAPNVDLSVDDADVLFRIAREAVINAVSHGKADLISITLSTARDGLHLDIRDNGIGIGPHDLDHRQGHLGTRAMRDRAQERGGNCRIEPDQLGGTLVSVWLPRQRRRATLLRSALVKEAS